MIVVACPECEVALRISPGSYTGHMSEAEALFGEQSEMFPSSYTCFKCQKSIARLVTGSDYLHDAVFQDVSPQEALLAMHGLGLPEERECGLTAVTEVLRGGRVAAVEGRMIRNSHRCIIGTIVMEDGTKLFLGSSAYGATVYRVSKPHSYVESSDG